MAILDLQRRLTELGRLRLGAQVSNKGGGTRPVKLERFRFTSPNRELIEAAAHIYGGEVLEWKGAPGDQTQWEVYSNAVALEAIVPPGAYLSQFMEMWSGGGCLRRCDGRTELLSDRDCLCPDDPQERRELAADGRACKPTTRISLILPRLPGFGVWRAEMHGYYAAVELAGAHQVASLATAQGQMIPVRLRLDQRERRRPGKPTLKFVVPVLELSATFGEVLQALGMGQGPLILAPTEVAARPALMPAPPDGDERVAMLGEGRAREGVVDLADGLQAVAGDGGELQRPPARGSARRAAPLPGAPPALGDSAFDGTPDLADIGDARPTVPPADPGPDPGTMPGTESATAPQIKALQTLASKLGWTQEERHELAGVASFKDLSKERAGELIEDWSDQANNRSRGSSADRAVKASHPDSPEQSVGVGEPRGEATTAAATRDVGGALAPDDASAAEPAPTQPSGEEPGDPAPSRVEPPLTGQAASSRSAAASPPDFDPSARPTDVHWKRALTITRCANKMALAKLFSETFGEKRTANQIRAGDLERLMDRVLHGQGVLA